MNIRRISGTLPKYLLFFSCAIFLLAGCGANASAGTSTVSSTAATATACTQATRPAASLKTALGTLKSINGQTLVLTNRQGNPVSVTYSNTTRFTQESSVAPTSLRDGTFVRVAVTSNGGTYSATIITVVAGVNGTNGSGFPGFPRGNGTPGAGRRTNNPCLNRNQAGTSRNGTNTFRGLTGAVSQLSGNTLTITDTTGADFSVTITPQTQILETKQATAAALKVGVALTIVGRADKQGTIAANTIAILAALPSGTTPTA